MLNGREDQLQAVDNFGNSVGRSTADGSSGIAVADVNGDRKSDVIALNFGSLTVSVLLDKGNGTLQGEVDYTIGTPPLRAMRCSDWIWR